MEKLVSGYLGEVEVEVTEIENGKKKVPHAFLADQIHNNQVCVDNKVQYMFRDIILREPGHYAAVCIVNDTNGRRVEGVGESTPNTRASSIAQNYPLLMAYNRAFDAAAIAFLGFPSGIVYSDSQIPDETAKGDQKAPAPAASSAKPATPPAKPAEAPAAAAINAKEEVEKTQSKAQPEIPLELEVGVGAKEDAQMASEEEGPPFPSDEDAPPFMDEDAPPPKAEAAPADTPHDENDPFSVMINFGKHKNKGWTVRELAANDPGFLEWVVNVMKATEKNKEQQDACRLWLAQNGSGNTDSAMPKENAQPATKTTELPESPPTQPSTKTEVQPTPQATKVETVAVEPDMEDPFSITITIGRHRDKGLSVRELAEKDLSSLEWVAFESPDKEANKKQQEACKLWLAQNKGGEMIA